MVYAVGIFFVFGVVVIPKAHAATEFITSWSSNSFVPSWYQGKAFPTYGSRINVAFEVLEDGKVADLSKVPVRWYVNDDLVLNEVYGNGIKTYSFVNEDYGNGMAVVRIMMPDYKGGVIGTTINIPTKTSELVFDIPYFQRKVERKDNQIKAWPFFFNINNIGQLNFRWKANGGAIEADKADPAKLMFSADNAAQNGAQFNIEARISSSVASVIDVVRSVTVELK